MESIKQRMKNSLLMILVLFVSFCSEGNNFEKLSDSLKVGMTYDDVEKVLGKPSEIVRGFNRFSDWNYSRLPKGEAKLFLAVIETTSEKRIWPYPPTIETAGQLIYVRWVFQKYQEDTFFVSKPIYEDRIVEIPVRKYFINKEEVSKDLYDSISDTVYRAKIGFMITKEDWLERKMSGWRGVGVPEPAIKVTVDLEPERKRQRVLSRIDKQYYVVLSKFCVTFDSSSGRLTELGYQPFFMSEVKDSG